MTAFVGIDLGTSALKAVAVSGDGAILATARRAYPTARPEAGAAEQDPADWWAALDGAIGDIARTVPPRTWAGVGLSGMLPTLVRIGDSGSALAPAITWEDARAEPQARELLGTVGVDRLYRVTGQLVDGRYLAPMYARLARAGDRAAVVAGAKDALFAHLTGELYTDPSTAAGFGVFDLDSGGWNSELTSAAGISRFPDVLAAGSWRPVLPAWRDRWELPEGLPVVLGAADSVLGALGIGATAPGDVAVIAGSSAIVLGLSATPVRDPQRRYLITPLAGAGWGLEMDLLAMGTAFDGIAALLGLPGPAALMAAAATVPAADAPLFLPYLSPGEQGALWDPGLTGTLHGLTLAMGAGHVGRALLTGVVNELRRCTEVLATATGCRGPILLGGGAAASPLLWQDLADATGREVWVDPAIRDHSALGAALHAAASLHHPVAVRGDKRIVAPHPARLGWWTDAAERHDELRLRLADP